MHHPLEQTISGRLREAAVAPGSRLVVGVSGGADSMALMHLLAALRPTLALTLNAVYIDHGLRPEETPREWACVQAAADRLGLERMRIAVDVPSAMAEGGLSLEETARTLRYRAFAEIARTWAADGLVVAHTADDQAEQVLLRLFRGGGGRALSGMRLRSGTLLRPLLCTDKVELLAYLHEHGIAYCHDSSNADPRFLRNRIRLELLPLLEQHYDPGIRHALRKTADNLAEDEDLLAELLAEVRTRIVRCTEDDHGHPRCRIERAGFRQCHPALQRRLIEHLFWELGNTARHAQILAVLQAGRSGRTGSELHLGQGLRLQVEQAALILCYPRGKGPWRGRLDPD